MLTGKLRGLLAAIFCCDRRPPGVLVCLISVFIFTPLFGSKLFAADVESRRLSLHHVQTGEDLEVTYWVKGKYDEDALNKLSKLLRDWRRNEAIKIDPRLFDLLWEIYRAVDGKQPIQILTGYRSPVIDEASRNRLDALGSGQRVTTFSQHMLGRAVDFSIPSISIEAIRDAALKLQSGGVGTYNSSALPFVHVDLGEVRMWPRLSREQLFRLFPDGKTVLIPSSGDPLPGYAESLAEIEHRRSAEQTSPPILDDWIRFVTSPFGFAVLVLYLAIMYVVFGMAISRRFRHKVFDILGGFSAQIFVLDRQVAPTLHYTEIDDAKVRSAVAAVLGELLGAEQRNALIKASQFEIEQQLKTYLQLALKEEGKAATTLKIAGALINDEYQSDKRSLVAHCDQHLAIANTIKSRMMNLFILFSLIALTFYGNLVYFGIGGDKVGNVTLHVSFIAAYLSLTTFIIYIYRSQNSRGSAALAILEDNKKLHDAMIILDHLNSIKDVSEHHVELMQHLLRNRAERERQVSHPYDVIIKGISNANVLLRGGKVSSAPAKQE